MRGPGIGTSDLLIIFPWGFELFLFGARFESALHPRVFPMNAPAGSNLTVANAPLPATYEAAKKALASCASMDECQDWANKAEAMASYAKQAKDETLRSMADRIRARAVRRLGELLKLYDAQGQRTDKLSDGADTKLSQKEMAERAGISKRQQVTAVRVANVPEDTFNEAVEAVRPATVSRLAEMGTTPQAPRPIDPAATAGIVAVSRFADFCAMNDPHFVAAAVASSQVPKMRKKVGDIDAWLDQFVVDLGE
jgi:hypothetical protein